eukprot:NODE_891_length_1255_cov_280.120232_g677_i0.p1 GENE.NODE_891_length_1255_cov_280.120232_g677_i0~~NODE_891_length_1255_cov_280.120232_g677_i0.p1  ORF type:complete len:377 (-),score=61.12 NODE_891_length_1255_cov_280.120232_g677_i0:62-1192(-)
MATAVDPPGSSQIFSSDLGDLLADVDSPAADLLSEFSRSMSFTSTLRAHTSTSSVLTPSEDTRNQQLIFANPQFIPYSVATPSTLRYRPPRVGSSSLSSPTLAQVSTPLSPSLPAMDSVDGQMDERSASWGVVGLPVNAELWRLAEASIQVYLPAVVFSPTDKCRLRVRAQFGLQRTDTTLVVRTGRNRPAIHGDSFVACLESADGSHVHAVLIRRDDSDCVRIGIPSPASPFQLQPLATLRKTRSSVFRKRAKVFGGNVSFDWKGDTTGHLLYTIRNGPETGMVIETDPEGEAAAAPTPDGGFTSGDNFLPPGVMGLLQVDERQRRGYLFRGPQGGPSLIAIALAGLWVFDPKCTEYDICALEQNRQCMPFIFVN